MSIVCVERSVAAPKRRRDSRSWSRRRRRLLMSREEDGRRRSSVSAPKGAGVSEEARRFRRGVDGASRRVGSRRGVWNAASGRFDFDLPIWNTGK